MKRVLESAAAAVALCALAPLIGTVGALVFAAEGRPILFTQVRSGLDGRPFKLRKFRTMSDARDDHGRLLADEQRLTAFGRILRRTRLDELPQLVNILLGQMSFVGPRPLPPAVLAAAADRGLTRSRVRPGLTGWAQVNGNARLSDAEKFALDEWYVGNRTAALDLKILLQTVLVLLRGERINQRAIRRAYARSPHRGG